MEAVPRILHVLASLNTGGAESMVMNIYRRIDTEKIQFDFIVHTQDKGSYEDEVIGMGGRIYRIPRYTGKNHFAYVKAWHDFFRNHPEYKIIHGHIRSTASIYLGIAKKYTRTTIIHSHSTSSGGGLSAIIKNVMQLPLRNLADYLFACSVPSGEWLFGKKACKRENFMVIKNAIDPDRYAFDELGRNRIRSELQLDGMYVVGHVGRFHPSKNHEFLLDIFKEIHEKIDNSVLLLVGEGELRTVIEGKIKRLEIGKSVKLTGNRLDVPDLLKAMDVFVFPSLWEGLPVSVVEAQASGLPCIVSDAITDEVFISPYIKSVSLSKNASEWADIALSLKKPDRYDGKSYVDKAGFDICETAKKLTLFYMSIEREKRA